MMKHSKDDFKTKLFSSKIFIICAFIVLVFATTGVAKELYRRYQIQEEISSLQAEIKRLEESNKEFSELIEFFKTESYLEKEARLKLQLQKPGEKVVVISPGSQEVSKEKEDEETNPEEISNPRRWWNYLFGSK